MRRLLFPVLISTATLMMGCQSTMQTPSNSEDSAAESFQQLLDDHWEGAVSEKIYFRNDPDAWRMDGKLSEHTEEARERRRIFNEEMLRRAAEVDVAQLDPRDQISYRVFVFERETERASYEQFDHLFPINSLFGYHTYFAEAPANMAFLDAEDYDDYLISLADFPRYNGERIAELRAGIETGMTHYCESISNEGDSIQGHIVEEAQKSALFVPFERFPAVFSDEQAQGYTEAGKKLINGTVVPEYRRLLTFFEEEYLPSCRQEAGLSGLARGAEYYQYLIGYFTTTDMAPQEIHDLGLSEVERIRGEMQEIIKTVGFDGDFREFLDFLRHEPSFYAKSVDELLGRAALISKTAEGELPRFFSVLPRGTYKVRPNPSRGTFYMPSSGDGTTSGTYFVGTESLDAQPFYTLESLTLHEGVPGHHLQSALAMEIGLPEFRRTVYHSAYGEGWGLYSERLGKEMGFYQDPYSDFGRLTYEAWRAVRLVVDTGIHSLGWSRDQALDYMLSNTAASELEAGNEIDRYITWPAQALSYKIGELKIRELRAKAEAALGPEFDIRSFHDTVVGNGSLPIAVLEEIVNGWISSAKP